MDRKSGSYRYNSTPSLIELELDLQKRREMIALKHENAKLRAQAKERELVTLIGKEALETWLDKLYADKEIAPQGFIGWNYYRHLCQQKIDEVISAECDHVLPEQWCSICAPHTTDEIPF